MTPAPTLLVDNSNTRTKFALAEGGAILPERRILPTAELTAAALSRTLEGWEYSRAIICSVVPAAADTLRRSLKGPVLEVSAAACPTLLRGYPAPASLGADRIANAAALAAHYPLPAVAVDLGTACTFDAVVQAADGPQFLGGAISPGLQTLAGGLVGRTALLPHTDTQAMHREAPGAIGRGTQAALQAGLYYGYLGMLSGIIRRMRTELPAPLCVVLTGGDATDTVAEALSAHSIDNNLTFKGMLSIFNHC